MTHHRYPEITELLTTKEVASAARVSPLTVRRWAKLGRLPSTKVVRFLRFKVEDVRSFLTKERW